MSTLANLDKTLNRQLKDPVVSTVIRVVLVLYILALSSVDRSFLELFENLYFQVFYFAALAYVAMVDPATAVLMAAAYLFSVQQLNRGLPAAPVASEEAGDPATPGVTEMPMAIPGVTEMPMATPMNGPGAMVSQSSSEGFENENGVVMGEADHPASRTMTENLFTSDSQFLDAQSNALPGQDQNTGIKSQTNQFSPQGLDLPSGYNPEDYLGAQF